MDRPWPHFNSKLMKMLISLLTLLFLLILFLGFKENKKKDQVAKTALESVWEVDFFDDFETFNPDNWQDQRIWVNNEKQCYVPDNAYNTREVSDGTLKIKVINAGEKLPCDNLDKHGNQHPETQYVAGRI